MVPPGLHTIQYEKTKHKNPVKQEKKMLTWCWLVWITGLLFNTVWQLSTAEQPCHNAPCYSWVLWNCQRRNRLHKVCKCVQCVKPIYSLCLQFSMWAEVWMWITELCHFLSAFIQSKHVWLYCYTMWLHVSPLYWCYLSLTALCLWFLWYSLVG